ncbi:polysaccharide pyruvyl transferase family protein [Ottowia caeni]|uniref:polysaccharide pyruvyl transferase family protein n=1 Tax=Ottowia caeni TaxID=2870339 RepID=UPI001E5D2782|nr:polysaccharide pyruvyl transferase family protein [Ottowia caeni]
MRLIEAIDRSFGAKHDYITSNPIESLELYKTFSKTTPRIKSLSDQLERSSGLIINGEGTLIFGKSTSRDALYILFAIALAREINKPVYLLNAMIAPCPYSGEDTEVVKSAIPLLEYCQTIAVREHQSYEYVSSKIGNSKLRLIPDALFTWGSRFRNCHRALQKEWEIGSSYPTHEGFSNISFNRPYVCISGSSSAWRYEHSIQPQFKKLVTSIQNLGYPVFCIETCDGDTFLKEVAIECGARFIPKHTSVFAAAGLIGGSIAYITGRYHPSIIASASGVPCIFLSSNSHKTSSIQKLLGYDEIIEFPICPNDNQISDILEHLEKIAMNRESMSRSILNNYNNQSDLAMSYKNIIEQ